jgi:cobalamin biosynthesis Mg chelatase CobN
MAADSHAEPECVAWDDCKEAAVASFEVAAGTGKAHPVCRPLTVCTDGQREVAPPTATSDRKCGDTTSTTTITTVTSTTSATSSTATETTATITTATETTTTITATTTSATSTTTTTSTTIKSSASSTTASASIAFGLGVLFLLVVLAVLCYHIRRRCMHDGQGCPPADVTKGSAGTPHVASNPM